MIDAQSGGCPCGECGNRYRVDLNVPDDIWRTIGMSTGGGLLCGRCIMTRIESVAARAGGYGYLLVGEAGLPRDASHLLPDYYGESTTGAPQARSIPDDREAGDDPTGGTCGHVDDHGQIDQEGGCDRCET